MTWNSDLLKKHEESTLHSTKLAKKTLERKIKFKLLSKEERRRSMQNWLNKKNFEQNVKKVLVRDAMQSVLTTAMNEEQEN